VIIVASDDRDNLDDEVARIEGTIYSGDLLRPDKSGWVRQTRCAANLQAAGCDTPAATRGTRAFRLPGRREPAGTAGAPVLRKRPMCSRRAGIPTTLIKANLDRT
jgi:hypothetical protein